MNPDNIVNVCLITLLLLRDLIYSSSKTQRVTCPAGQRTYEVVIPLRVECIIIPSRQDFKNWVMQNKTNAR